MPTFSLLRVHLDPTAPNQLMRKCPGRSETAVPKIWYLFATNIPPNSWWSPGQHSPFPAHLLYDVTITSRHDATMRRQGEAWQRSLRLTFKRHLRYCSPQKVNALCDHSAVLQPSYFNLALNIKSKLEQHITGVWIEAYWFLAMSLSKWSLGSYIGFFLFPDSNFS